MEVHAHSHSTTNPGHRKKWTHYFWEFLMLFLAVFCGFLAEYQLEHKIEKDREKQFMHSMLEDLKSDAAMLSDNYQQRRHRILMIDSLVAFFNQPDQKTSTNNAYYYARSISPPLNIFTNDRTIQQLKSSGNLRLIRKQDVSNSIMAYDQKVRQALFEMGDEVEIRAEYRQLAARVFNTRVFNAMLATDTIAKPRDSPPLYTSDPDLINQFIGALQYTKRVHQAQLVRAGELLKQANELMEKIKVEYHIK